MIDKYFHKVLFGRNVYIDDRFDIPKILEIIEIFLYENCDARGYLPFGMSEVAEQLDAKIYPFYHTVNVSVDQEAGKFSISVNWDEEMIWRDMDKTTQMVYDVLRGIS